MNHVRQAILWLFMLSAFALLVIPPKERESVPKDRLVLHYWSYWSGKEADQMQEIIDTFNDTVGKEKGIYVQYISMSQSDQKTLIATAAGVPPDIAGIWGDQLAAFAAMNALEPLDQLAAEHGITRDYYKPVYWDACSYDGKLYSLIATPYSVGLYWNKQIFADRAPQLRAAGLDPTRPPKTIQELDKYAEALEVWSGPKDKGGQLVAAGFFEQQPGWWREHVYYWFGGNIYDPKNQKLTLDDPKVIQGFEWIRSYTQRIGKDQVLRFSSGLPAVDTFDTPLNPFMTGKLAMMKQGPWFSSYMEKLKPEMNRWKMSKEEEHKLPREQQKDNYVWGATAFPSAVPGLGNVSFAGVDVLAIPSTGKHKKEAFEFIAFVNRQDQMEKLCSLHGKNSPLAKMSQEYLQNHFNPYIDVFEMLGASPNIHAVPSTPIWPEIRSELQAVAGAMVLNEKTAREALVPAQARLQARLDDFNARAARRKAEGLER